MGPRAGICVGAGAAAPRGRRHRRGPAVLAGVLGLALLAAACQPAAPPPPPNTILVYGDSFLTQIQAYLAPQLLQPGWQVVIRQYPGTAICDWIPQMRQDAATIPRAYSVVLVFTGNMLTPCTQGRGDETTVYTQDATTAVGLWRAQGARVALVGPPGSVNTTGPDPLDAVFSSVASSLGAAYFDGGANLHDANDGWPWLLPCASYDTSDGCGAVAPGLVQVRTSGGQTPLALYEAPPPAAPLTLPPDPDPTAAANPHLCDVGYSDPTIGCPVPSSGVLRYGMVVAAAGLWAEL